MSLQIDLFASAEQLVNNVYKLTDERLHPDEKPRLNQQCIDILKLVLSFPREMGVSNIELSKIALRYSARLYDIKKATGIEIGITVRDFEGGVNWYGFKTPADREKAEAVTA